MPGVVAKFTVTAEVEAIVSKVNALLDAASVLRFRPDHEDEILRLAAAAGLHSLVDRFIEAGCLPSGEDNFFYSNTPLGAAASAGQAKSVAMLLAAGASPNDHNGVAIYEALTSDAPERSEILDMLMRAGADPLLTSGAPLRRGLASAPEATAELLHDCFVSRKYGAHKMAPQIAARLIRWPQGPFFTSEDDAAAAASVQIIAPRLSCEPALAVKAYKFALRSLSRRLWRGMDGDTHAAARNHGYQYLQSLLSELTKLLPPGEKYVDSVLEGVWSEKPVSKQRATDFTHAMISAGLTPQATADFMKRAKLRQNPGLVALLSAAHRHHELTNQFVATPPKQNPANTAARATSGRARATRSGL